MSSSSTAVCEPMPLAPSEKILQDVFGYQSFRIGQQEVIEAVIEGQDCLVIMPTGGR